MSIVLIVVGVILLLIVMVIIAAARMKDDYSITESIVINRPVDTVFEYVRHLRHADHYNKWTMLDPNVKRTFLGTDGTVAFVAGWESDMKQVGKGEQEITAISEGRRIDWALRFEKPFANEAMSYMTTEAVSDRSTKVGWVFAGKRNLAMKIFHLLFNLRKMLGRDLGESLRNLKKVLEE